MKIERKVVFMSLVKKGTEAKASIQKEKIDLKQAFIRLKNENESIPVRVLGVEDYVTYKTHSDFNKKLFNTPCLEPLGEFCPYCVAKEKGGEEWSGFYAKERAMFAFADLNSGQVKVLEVSKGQAKKLIAQIEEYADEIEAGEVAFNLTRTGSGQSTGYSLNMMTAKKMQAVQDKFNAFDGVTVDVDFFEDRLVVKSATYMVNLLEDAGFDVDANFDASLVATARAEKEALMGKDEAKPIEDDTDVPF